MKLKLDSNFACFCNDNLIISNLNHVFYLNANLKLISSISLDFSITKIKVGLFGLLNSSNLILICNSLLLFAYPLSNSSIPVFALAAGHDIIDYSFLDSSLFVSCKDNSIYCFSYDLLVSSFSFSCTATILHVLNLDQCCFSLSNYQFGIISTTRVIHLENYNSPITCISSYKQFLTFWGFDDGLVQARDVNFKIVYESMQVGSVIGVYLDHKLFIVRCNGTVEVIDDFLSRIKSNDIIVSDLSKELESPTKLPESTTIKDEFAQDSVSNIIESKNKDDSLNKEINNEREKINNESFNKNEMENATNTPPPKYLDPIKQEQQNETTPPLETQNILPLESHQYVITPIEELPSKTTYIKLKCKNLSGFLGSRKLNNNQTYKFNGEYIFFIKCTTDHVFLYSEKLTNASKIVELIRVFLKEDIECVGIHSLKYKESILKCVDLIDMNRNNDLIKDLNGFHYAGLFNLEIELIKSLIDVNENGVDKLVKLGIVGANCNSGKFKNEKLEQVKLSVKSNPKMISSIINLV